MGVFNTMLNAMQAGYLAARRVFEDPAQAYQQRTYQEQAMQYSLMWSYYNNSMFERLAHPFSFGSLNGQAWGPWIAAQTWAAYRANYNLYRNIRLLYNPTRRLVDFYAGQIYPGLLSKDGAELPDGVPLAVPFSKDTDPTLKAAIAQFWQWSNWQAKKSLQVRIGGALGSVLVELIDDVEHGKVAADIIWPGFIYDLELDHAGNVKSYCMQYQVYDPEEGSHLFRKEVDLISFRYYRDDAPYDYGYGAEVENPYGFIPAVWIKHQDSGGDHGSPAIAGSFGKIDELNNLVSHTHDQIHKVIGAPKIIFSSGAVSNLFGTQKRGSTSEFVEPSSDQESVLMLKGPADGKVDSLAGNLDLAAVDVHIGRLLEEIEDSHPELTFYKKLQEMSQVTGPAASRLVGNVETRVLEAKATYDIQNIKLFQMAVAMAGFRARSGAWGPLNRQQQKFAAFDLDSYERGNLDMEIMPRPLLTPTKLEQAQEKQAFWLGIDAAVKAGMPLELALRDEGWTEDQIAELVKLKQQKAAEALKMQQAMQPPQQQQPGQNQPGQSSQNGQQHDTQNAPVGR